MGLCLPLRFLPERLWHLPQGNRQAARHCHRFTARFTPVYGERLEAACSGQMKTKGHRQKDTRTLQSFLSSSSGRLPAATPPLDLTALWAGGGQGPEDLPAAQVPKPRLQRDPSAGGAAGGAAATGGGPRDGEGRRLHGGDLASHRPSPGMGRGCSPPPPAVRPPLHRGEGRPTGAGGRQGLSHCRTPRRRSPSASAWWASALCLLPPGGEGRGRQPDGCCPLPLPPRPSRGRARALTEALLEPDSSSALGG